MAETSFDPTRPFLVPRDQQLRIEALRAASRITEAKIAAGEGFMSIDGKNVREQTWMLTLTEIIAHYLETGEK